MAIVLIFAKSAKNSLVITEGWVWMSLSLKGHLFHKTKNIILTNINKSVISEIDMNWQNTGHSWMLLSLLLINSLITELQRRWREIYFLINNGSNLPRKLIIKQ